MESIFANTTSRMCLEEVTMEKEVLSTAEIKTLIEQKRAECAYGLCLIASDRRTLRFYEDLSGLGCDLFYPASRNLANALIISPAADADLSGYRDFIFLDAPSDYNILALQGKTVFVNGEICGYKLLRRVDTAREHLLEIFAALRREVNTLRGDNVEELAFFCDALGFDKCDFIFALTVFLQLGLVAFEDGRLTVYRGVKAELTDSSVYRKVCALKEN